jgi:hypothetical protein
MHGHCRARQSVHNSAIRAFQNSAPSRVCNGPNLSNPLISIEEPIGLTRPGHHPTTRDSIVSLQSRFVRNVRGNMAARRLQLFAQREWANELSSFSVEISGQTHACLERVDRFRVFQFAKERFQTGRYCESSDFG